MKTRTTLSREMTINTGNFSNIKPSVSMSVVHNIEHTDMVYSQLAGILDSLMALETLALAGEIEVSATNGWGFYKRALERSVDEINDGLKEHIKVLSSILERDNG